MEFSNNVMSSPINIENLVYKCNLLCSQEHERVSIRFGLNPPLKSRQSTVDRLVIRAALLVQRCPVYAVIGRRLWILVCSV
uniref:Uncharacterized protein n=1 Tax=Populus trichocarpa TaxID=3694 RepID=U5G5J5_POPTR